MELQVLLDFWLKPLCQTSQEYTRTTVIYYCVIMPVCLTTDSEFYQAACPLVSGNQLLWSAKKPEVLCQTLLINWERAWAQLQVALRKFQRALSTLLSSSQYELGIILKSHSLHRAGLPFKDCATLDYCTRIYLHPKTAKSVGVFQMTTVRAGLSPQSETRCFRRKWKKKKILHSLFFYPS